MKNRQLYSIIWKVLHDELGSCTCSVDYTSRKMIDPSCHLHLYEDMGDVLYQAIQAMDE